MNTILVAINSKYIHSNLAVYSLRAYAKKYRDEVRIAEYTINQQVDEILMDLYKRKPELLCFSCYIWNLNFVEELTGEFHRLCPDVPIWVGGPEVSYDAKDVLERLPEVTGVICGEGEETFRKVLDFYHGDGSTLSDIQGITYRDAEGIVQANPWREAIDLSDIPFVYEDLDAFSHRIIYYESSRGCPFSCSYCLSSIDKHLRFRDLDLVKKELQFFIDHEVAQVKFVDRTFNCNHNHAMEIWSYLLEHDKGKTNFHFEVAADLLNEEELDLIAKMRPGLIQLEIGVQSTNGPTIEAIHRTMKFERVAEVVRRIQKAGNIHQHLDLIAGLPYEDLPTFRRSFDDVYALHPEQLQLGFLKVLKGSYMEAHREEYGLLYKAKPPYEVRATKWLSFDDILELKAVEEMVEVYYNSGQFTYTLHNLEKEYPGAYQMYRALAAFYEAEGLHLVSHSRIARYEILMDFINKYHPERADVYRELLTFDLYLRENVKNRPEFAGPYRISGEMLRDFYKERNQKEQRKMTHLELFSVDVMGDCKEKEVRILFDYANRSPLDNQARVFRV